jgi:tryptophan 2,3-dioxygenase
VGTGGSSGAAYLKSAAESHIIFKEIAEISSFLMPRNALPQLPDVLVKDLSYNKD